ncbi:thialysine N-epsilon-acetyltransferase-like isoform X1 [Syngnathus scovelli]|uniref:thialysine N-epsilon-acetyltransferase-like isoform X1 n=1 Tax=Syngnathus scovelli TaxID=161590 RepID=UPI00210FD733|nr:thialysine N-epsilon-acetyltransferase-like isoform X1 [Syngnathus scovelli]
MNFAIRPTTKADCKDIWRLLRDLAIHENMLNHMRVTYEELERDAFSQNPWFESLVAEVPEENKSKEGFRTVGLAVYFYSYSTWKGRTVYLEDLYVMPEFRGHTTNVTKRLGIGNNLLSTLAKVARQKQCVQLELNVLGQNISSRSFYAAKGAEDITVRDDWHTLRFDAQSLNNLDLLENGRKGNLM